MPGPPPLPLEPAVARVSLLVADYVRAAAAAQQMPPLLSAPVGMAHCPDTIERFATELATATLGPWPAALAAAPPAAAREDTQAAARAFHASVGQQTRDFVVLMGFTRHAAGVLRAVRRAGGTAASRRVRVGADTVCAAVVPPLQELCTALDLLMALAGGGGGGCAGAKPAFYAVWQQACDELQRAAPPAVLGVFWAYVEARAQRMRATVFRPDSTPDRIAVLGLCNAVTDRPYVRRGGGGGGPLDSYAKDTFRDALHARVRVFAASMLRFDDVTGLNKAFRAARRVPREPPLRATGSADDHLLEDAMRLRGLLRDPGALLHDPRRLAEHAAALAKLHAYLLGEETKYRAIHPVRAVRAVPAAGPAAAARPHADPAFFPEHYWLSVFAAEQSGARFDELRAEDQRRAQARFDSSKFRRLLLLQIYLASCFFVELAAGRKAHTLARAGAPAAARHPVDAATPPELVPRFAKLRRDTVRVVRAWDPAWAATLEGLARAEGLWWAWLLSGAPAGAAPVDGAALRATEQRLRAAAPEKTRRYFHTHATPQLSRRMREPTGLLLLRGARRGGRDYAAELARVAARIDAEHDAAARAALVEERTVLLWQQTRALRGAAWLSLDGHLEAAALDAGDAAGDAVGDERALLETAQLEEKLRDGNLLDEKLRDGNLLEEKLLDEKPLEKAQHGPSAHEEPASPENPLAPDAQSGNASLAAADTLALLEEEKNESVNRAFSSSAPDALGSAAPDAVGSAAPEGLGDRVTESRVAMVPGLKSAGTAAQAVADPRKRARAPDDEDDDGTAAKKARAAPPCEAPGP